MITGKLMNEEGIDDHHVFPANFLEVKEGIALSRHARLRAQPHADRPHHQPDDQRPAPSDYLAEIRNTPGFPFDAVLARTAFRWATTRRSGRNDYEASWPGGRSGCGRRSSASPALTEAADLEADDKEEA